MLPKEYGSGSTCHRRYQEWIQLGIFDKLWTRLLQKYDKKVGIKWDWQSLDSISIKSPFLGGAMTEVIILQTDRSKLGSKRHILTDKNGIHLSTFITSANTHDVTVATNTIDNIVIIRPISSYDQYHHHTTNPNINRIYVLTKHIIPKK